MDFNEIKKMLKLMEENDIAEFEMERDGFKISLKKGQRAQVQPKSPAESGAIEPTPTEKKAAAEKETDSNLEIIEAPMVGTFYAAPSPDSPPYMTVGQEVKENDVLCVVEAMKVMNEIQSEISGVIKKILVKNGEAVEYGQPMFKVERT